MITCALPVYPFWIVLAVLVNLSVSAAALFIVYFDHEIHVYANCRIKVSAFAALLCVMYLKYLSIECVYLLHVIDCSYGVVS